MGADQGYPSPKFGTSGKRLIFWTVDREYRVMLMKDVL
jgi:hypothetical protein